MKKIMFNDKYSLTELVLRGRKTMTRRFINGEYTSIIISEGKYLGVVGNEKDYVRLIPRYKAGEVVAIAQSYKSIHDFYSIAYNRHISFHGQTITEYDIPFKNIIKWLNMRESLRNKAGWNNKLYVSSEQMLHHIRIINIRLERLQDISEEDCLREGIEEHYKGLQYGFPSSIGFCDQYPYDTPRGAYAALINKISGKSTWESNPYVFAYSFELID